MIKRILRQSLLVTITAAVTALITVPLVVQEGATRLDFSPRAPGVGEARAQGTPPAPSQAQVNQGGLLLGAPTIADVAEKVTPSVVTIFSTRAQRTPQMLGNPFEFFFGPRGIPERQLERKQRSLGSGVIVSRDGYVLTNNHVVQDAGEILVTLADSRELTAKVVGTDPPSDLALLKIPADNLPPIAIGDSSRIRIGDLVLAIGNPLGVGQTVTMGIISAVGRANTGIVDYEDFIQTDAAINPGNSGGALVNLQGELIGVNTAIASMTRGYQGIGFAIPSAMALLIKDSLLRHGKVVRGWLGVSIQNVTPDLAEGMGLTPGKGVLIADVGEDSPAAKAGLQREDVVLSVDGVATNDMGRLRTTIANKGAGAKVMLRVLRKGQELKLPVTLVELPSEGGDQERLQGKAVGPLAGLSLRPADGDLRQKYRLPRQLGGLVVVGLDPESPAAGSGLREGDVIVEVNRARVETVEQLQRVVTGAKRSVLLLVYRQGYTLFLTLRK